MTLYPVFIRIVIATGILSVSLSNAPAVLAQQFEQTAGPLCQVSRMQVPAGPGLVWKQIVDCPND